MAITINADGTSDYDPDEHDVKSLIELRGRGHTADFFQDSTVCLPCTFCMPNWCKNPNHVN